MWNCVPPGTHGGFWPLVICSHMYCLLGGQTGSHSLKLRLITTIHSYDSISVLLTPFTSTSFWSTFCCALPHHPFLFCGVPPGRKSLRCSRQRWSSFFFKIEHVSLKACSPSHCTFTDTCSSLTPSSITHTHMFFSTPEG